jgi:mono/diheme cytochrome c family protein
MLATRAGRSECVLDEVSRALDLGCATPRAAAPPPLAWSGPWSSRPLTNVPGPQPRSLLLFLAIACAGVVRAQQSPAAADDSFTTSMRPLLTKYCGQCHSTERHKGDLDLEQFTSLELVRQQPHVWELVQEQLGNGEMPPAGKPQPEPAEREQLVGHVRALLAELAKVDAGDPGPVVLRRLNNAEYTFTIRDLTGVASLSPAREFPADGAAGEGFANVGNALAVSPMLVDKYLQAARGIAAHAVLLPHGLGFRAGTERREWTEDVLARLRAFHQRFTEADAGERVDLQGVVFTTNGGGRLPLAKYLAASLALRDAEHGSSLETNVARLAAERGLSAKYLGLLLQTLRARDASPLLDAVRARWRTAVAADLPALQAEIEGWQRALFHFQSVGHIGKVGGPTAWCNASEPVVPQQEFRLTLPAAGDAASVAVHLVAVPVVGSREGRVVWHQPRLQRPGQPDLLLRDLRHVAAAIAAARANGIATVERCLQAAAELRDAAISPPIEAVAQRRGIDQALLQRWCAYLGIAGAPRSEVPITAYLDEPVHDANGHSFLAGFRHGELPCLLANASDRDVQIPGTVAAHSVVVHPLPDIAVVVGWRAPVAAVVSVRATIQHAHLTCGNGVAWTLDLQRGAQRWRLQSGIAQDGTVQAPPPVDDLSVQRGDLLSLRIGARGADHTCDLTRVDLAIATEGDAAPQWQLSADITNDVLAGNPHADRFGNAAVWHFFSEPEAAGAGAPAAIPGGSVLARWLAVTEPEQRRRLGAEVAAVLAASPLSQEGPDAELQHQLLAIDGPLCGGLAALLAAPNEANTAEEEFGLDPARFGEGPESDALGAPAASTTTFRIPAELAAGASFVTTAGFAVPAAGGAVQFRVLTGAAATAKDRIEAGPIVAGGDVAARSHLAAALAQFRAIFPAAMCYAKIVPVDEVITLTLFHREDEPLRRLLLDDAQTAELDRLWEELHFVSQDALLMVDVFEQLWQYVTQDGDPSQFEPLREPIRRRAEEFAKVQLAAEPSHVEAALAWAERAWRRPLRTAEQQELRTFYANARGDGLAHDAAIRLLLARVMMAPAFLYHCEEPGPRADSVPVTDWELASRLSYFLWSSVPDDELRAVAAAGRLREPGQLGAQAHRMLRDERVRRLASEFGCAWLHVQGFDELDEKSERYFPDFAGLRGAMYEESIRFFADFFASDASVLDLLAGDHVFVNGPLAAHYGIPSVEGDAWQRIDGARQYGRGGVLGLAACLSKQAGASRTSPILRGNWVAEALLGDRLPRPPKDVPKLPEEEAGSALSMRELTIRHSSDARCAHCHQRIDAFGLALEQYDGIGRRRTNDLGGRPIDAHAVVRDGTPIEGLAGLRDYLLQHRRQEFVRQFARKLLGYALGRAVQLTDEPLLDTIQQELAVNDFRIGIAIDRIVASRQFREIRGREHAEH